MLHLKANTGKLRDFFLSLLEGMNVTKNCSRGWFLGIGAFNCYHLD